MDGGLGSRPPPPTIPGADGEPHPGGGAKGRWLPPTLTERGLRIPPPLGATVDDEELKFTKVNSTFFVTLLDAIKIWRLMQGCFLTLILSTVEHLVLILLEFLEFLVEFSPNLLEFLFKIA